MGDVIEEDNFTDSWNKNYTKVADRKICSEWADVGGVFPDSTPKTNPLPFF